MPRHHRGDELSIAGRTGGIESALPQARPGRLRLTIVCEVSTSRCDAAGLTQYVDVNQIGVFCPNSSQFGCFYLYHWCGAYQLATPFAVMAGIAFVISILFVGVAARRPTAAVSPCNAGTTLIHRSQNQISKEHQMSNVKLAVIFYSSTGTNFKVAKAVAEGGEAGRGPGKTAPGSRTGP